MASVNGCRLYKASKSSHNQNVYVFWLSVGDSGGAGGERARGQSAAGRFRVCLQQWSPGQSGGGMGLGWVGSRDIWEVELTGPEE